MALLYRISRRARALFAAATIVVFVCSAHHSFTTADRPGSHVAVAREAVAKPAPATHIAVAAFCDEKIAPSPADFRVEAEPLSVTGAPLIALTFDDGPWPGQTEPILGILTAHNVPATFFMLGKQVEDYPAIAQQVVRAGMAVGNHSYDHRRLDRAPAEVTEWEIAWTTYRIESVTGVHPGWMRPPGGNFGPNVYASIQNSGARPVLWDVDPQDWRSGETPDQIAWNVISTARPGGVILLHDGGGDQSQTITALSTIIEVLQSQGYQFVTLDDLPAVRAGW